jgi:hypothetical protein
MMQEHINHFEDQIGIEMPKPMPRGNLGPSGFEWVTMGFPCKETQMQPGESYHGPLGLCTPWQATDMTLAPCAQEIRAPIEAFP